MNRTSGPTYDESRYAVHMPLPISVRLDEEAEQALRLLESRGMSRSDAIRSAILGEARRLRSRASLAEEVAALEADESDRSEMLAVADFMESLRAEG